MTLIQRLSIRIKLLLLAGVPVIGALVLAVLIARDARDRAASAAALGSVEDLARLSAQMNGALRAMQTERAIAALCEGLGGGEGADDAQWELDKQTTVTDAARAELERFLHGRDLATLPTRLAQSLGEARSQMAELPAFRAKLAADSVPVDDVLAFYGRIDKSLVAATASLTTLSDDGEILRSISALVAIAELSERVSAEHALLASVAAQKQFPAGSFKTLVTLVTEQAIYADVFRSNASDESVRLWNAEQESEAVKAALALREQTIASTSETVELDARAWFDAEAARIRSLHKIEDRVTQRVAAAASNKVAVTRASIRLSMGLSAAVLFSSAVLAVLIARGITRPVVALSSAAARVRTSKDFAIRVEKESDDELGSLTDSFNEMLSDIQARDTELAQHRGNLEALIMARTSELEARNEAMRIVLDNVEQGLVKVSLDGTLGGERSAKFDALFGAPAPKTSFAKHIAPANLSASEMLELGWETARDGFFPVDVALDQLPKRIEHEGKHLTLAFRPLFRGDTFEGALLVVSDVTAETEARRDHELQREYVAIFERVAQDRDGFAAFSHEMGVLLDSLSGPMDDVASVMATVHTVKGNAAQWGVSSVALIAHELESQIVESQTLPTEEQRIALFAAWDAVLKRFGAQTAGADGHVELSRAEIDGLLTEIWARAPHEALAEKVERFRDEPTVIRFQRMETDITRLAERLGKAKPRVLVESNGVRLPAKRFGAFWASMVHVVRNAMDHGIETPEERKVAGKPEMGAITLRATETPERITIECSDDGAGIDWHAVAFKAQAAGLPSITRADLQAALFASGVSTAKTVSDVSGRGVGLAAVLERCTTLDGTVAVTSTRGAGTRITFSFPRHASGRSNSHLPVSHQRAC